jgi:hypothetical protein
MTRVSATAWRVTPLCMTLLLSCGGDRSRSPTCGMAQLIGPSLIQDQLRRLPYVLTDAPRGLPGSLPARVAGTNQLSAVAITAAGRRLAMTYQGQNFPPFPTDTTVYGLLVVDDSSQRAEGVLLYEGQRPPKTYPELGTVIGDGRTIPLYGVRVDWASVSNLRCPLLGPPTGTTPRP